MKNNRIKRDLISLSLIFSCLFASAQIQLKQIKRDQPLENKSIILISDVLNPLNPDNNRIIVSELTHDGNNTYARYHFETTSDNAWFKNCVLFKMGKFHYVQNGEFSLYDLKNKSWACETVYNNLYSVMLSKEDRYPYYHYRFMYNAGSTYLYSHRKKGSLDLFLRTYNYDGKKYVYYYNSRPGDLTPYYFTLSNVEYISDTSNDTYFKSNLNYHIIERTYKLGNTYNTVAFPYDVTIRSGNHIYNNGTNEFIVYKLESVENNVLHFTRDISGKFLANVPYIVVSQKGDNTTKDQKYIERYLSDTPIEIDYDFNFNIHYVMQSGDISVGTFYGYEENSKTIKSNTYFMHGNKLVNSKNYNGGVNLHRFRWFVQNNGNQPVTMTFDGMTDVESVDMDVEDGDTYVYDISGKKCGTKKDAALLKKGYYVVDGRVQLLGD